jgi:hypothetical protein
MKATPILFFVCLFITRLAAQSAGDVIITEIGNNGGKKGTYRGGDYIELKVIKEGTVLAGWYLCDYSSPTSEGKERQGAVQFLGDENSIFAKPLPAGTIVLVCLDSPEMKFGTQKFEIDRKLDDGNNRLVLFPYDDSTDCKPAAGRIGITGKDNVVLASKLAKKAVIDAVSWGRELKWEYADVVNLPLEALDNGCIAFLKKSTPVEKRTDPANWVSTTDDSQATPGEENN